MLEEVGLCQLRIWFLEVKWSPDLKLDNKRVVWWSCYGVPLNIWNTVIFINIGNYWVDFITLDEETSKGSSFAVGKVKIIINIFASIDQKIYLEAKGCSYFVRVMEKQVIVNNVMSRQTNNVVPPLPHLLVYLSIHKDPILFISNINNLLLISFTKIDLQFEFFLNWWITIWCR